MPREADELRRLRAWAALLLGELALGGALAIGGRLDRQGEGGHGSPEVARALDLSGIAIGSGAAYTRHPGQADRFAAWSEHPGAFEHLPAGSLIRPPEARSARGARRAATGAESDP